MLNRLRWILFAVACVSNALPAAPIFFSHVRVFDGVTTIADTNVLVNGDKIEALGTQLQAPTGANVIDGRGKTLLPGLVDSHVHVWTTASLKQHLMFGVTAVLDMFTTADAMQALRKALDSQMADFRSAGVLVTAPGGHGTEFGLKIPTIKSPAEAQAFVDARIAEGSDYIKIIYDDFNGAFSKISPETLAAVIEAAHARGKMAVVHITFEKDARAALLAGADGLVHLFVGDSAGADFGKLAAAHHAFVIPTLEVLHTLCNDPMNNELLRDSKLAPLITPADHQSIQKTFDLPMKLSCAAGPLAIRQLKAAGVPILAGTDTPNPGTAAGVSLHGELKALVDAGLTPTEALTAATAAPAKAFHLDDRGRIAPGKRAELLLVNGDPTEHITATRDIAGIWKQGVAVDRAAYLTSVAADQAQASKLAAAPALPGSESGGSESGKISDFEGAAISAHFGAWSPTTDSIAGGKSTVKVELQKGGAAGTAQALHVTGEILPTVPYAWAGVMFSPGRAPFAPANLSSKKAVRFWAKGDGKTYRVMVYTQAAGYMPQQKTFVAGAEWKEEMFPLAAFNTDGHDITALIFCGGPAAGPIDLSIDQVEMQ